jgi:hypothetical protein
MGEVSITSTESSTKSYLIDSTLNSCIHVSDEASVEYVIIQKGTPELRSHVLFKGKAVTDVTVNQQICVSLSWGLLWLGSSYPQD